MRECTKVTKIVDIDVYQGKSLKLDFGKLKDLSISKILLSSIDVAYGENQEECNDTVLRICKEKNEIKALPLASVNLKQEQTEEYLKKLSTEFVGVKIFPFYHKYSLEDEEILERISVLEEKNLPLIIQLRIKWQDSITIKLDGIRKVARMYSKLPIILTGINYGENLEILRFIKPLNNVYISISYYQPLSGVSFLIKHLGYRRILFGTGYPINYPEIAILKVVYADISDYVKDYIFYENAERVFSTD